MTRLPPMTALRSFEVAARHLSFTRAAEELFVTQAAISHQIKALEQDLGVSLFRRLNRSLALTEEGQTLLPYVRDGFEQLVAGVQQLEQLSLKGTLNLSTTPSFAGHWLIGRLGRLRSQHPEIELRLSATERQVDLPREGIDCAVRHGMGDWPGLRADRLFQAAIVPVCSPSLLKGPVPLTEPADLARHTILHAMDGADEWLVWLRAAGVEGLEMERSLQFDNGELALKAAISGIGVAMGRLPLIDDDLADGRLVTPFDLEFDEQYAYYFIAPETTADQPKVDVFRSWILSEVARMEPPVL